MAHEDILSNIASPVILREELGGVIYEGRSMFPNPATNDPVWQIKRILKTGQMTITEYAMEDNASETEWHTNNVKKTCVWDDRADYFAPITPSEMEIVDQVIPIGISYSDAIDTRDIAGFSLQAIYSGAPLGGANTISIQASIDKTAWADLLDSDKSIEGAGDFMWIVSKVFYNYIRIKFDYDTAIQTKIIYTDRKF